MLQKLPTFQAVHMATLLHALGQLAAKGIAVPPPAWTAATADHFARRLMTFNGPALAQCAWGLSVMGYTASPKVRVCGGMAWEDGCCAGAACV